MRDVFGKMGVLGLLGAIVVNGLSRVSRNSFLLVRGGSEGDGLNENGILLVIKGRCRAMRGSILSKLAKDNGKSFWKGDLIYVNMTSR